MKTLIGSGIIICIFHLNGICQGINNLWVMGYQSGSGIPLGGTNIDFSTGTPNIYYINRNMDFDVTNGVICDKNGNMLFWSNGLSIANAQNTTMQNGGGLNPGAFTNNYPFGMPIIQGNLIIPVPGDTSKYYLFHETCKYMGALISPRELFNSIIDMNLNNGTGTVLSKNNIILQDTLVGGELCATKHANGRDWWLLSHNRTSNKFYTLLITPYGITVTSQVYGMIHNDYGGQGAFSPDGSKFVHFNFCSDVDIYDFDRCSGQLSNYVNIPIYDTAYSGGIAISPNNKVLYVPAYKKVHQYDLTATNIASSDQIVAVWDTFYSPNPPFATVFYLAQLAPDDKIYINCGNSTVDMHVINYPDSLGLACDLQQHSVHLPTYNAFTIANHPNYFLGSIPGGPCDSLTPIAEIKTNTIPIRINPNPAQNTFYLNYKLPYGKTAIATFYNTLGQQVIRKSLYWYFGYLEIDCSGLENGVYVVKVDGGRYQGVGKVVVAR